jgi:lipoprotein-releasing system permease protein
LNFLFAWRYFKSKKTTTAINVIAWVSVAAITIGTAALIIVLSFFNGFESLVKSLYSDFYADIRVAPIHGKTIQLTKEQINKIRSGQGIAQISLIAEEKALLVNDEKQSIVIVKGVDENYATTTNISKHIIRGEFNLGNAETPSIVIGSGIENAVDADVQRGINKLALNFLDKTKKLNTADAFTSYNVAASGTYLIQQDFDNKYIFSNLSFMKFMLNMQADEYSSAEIKLAANSNEIKIKKQLQNILGSNYKIETRYEQNKSLYNVMAGEKWITYAILTLILIVASFNMIGALTMLVLEKQKDIAVLKAMGGSNNLIQKIFLSEGVLLASIGGLAGIFIAVIFCYLQIHFKLIPLAGASFIIDYYPIQLQPMDFILVAITVIIIALAASWIPSRKASLQEFSLKS